MKTPQNGHSAQNAANVLDVYKHACELMHATDALNQLSAQVGNMQYVVPVLILDSFSIELFLKCIFIIENGQTAPHIHHLHNLYLKLTKPTRSRIEQIWKWYVNREEDKWRALEKQTGRTITRELDSLLKVGSLSFELLRYHYDKKEQFEYHLYGLSHILDVVTIELKPELAGLPADWKPLTEITDIPPRESVDWEVRSRKS